MNLTPRYGEGSLAVIFQGQNVAHPEMGRNLYERYGLVKELFRTASGIVGQDMRDICFAYMHDWTSLQREPRYVQPANILTEIAEYLVLQEETDGVYSPDVTTGLSLGLYASLFASKATSAETTIYIASERGKIVGENAKRKPGAMLAVKDLEARVEDLLAQHPSLVNAVKWGTDKILTVSGARGAAQATIDWAQRHGATVELSIVQEAAHNLLQLDTQPPLRKVLEAADIMSPQIDLASNDPLGETTYLLSKQAIIKHFLDQMIEPADWATVLDMMLADGVDRVVEIGPGVGDKEGHLSRGMKRRSRVEALTQRQAIGRGAIEIVKYKELLAA